MRLERYGTPPLLSPADESLRQTLGAQSANILKTVVTQGLVLVSIGLGAAVLGALLSSASPSIVASALKGQVPRKYPSGTLRL
jgi:predicted lysophospholipase L1 biosynthesis ABC-type transport system permease subunit